MALIQKVYKTDGGMRSTAYESHSFFRQCYDASHLAGCWIEEIVVPSRISAVALLNERGFLVARNVTSQNNRKDVLTSVSLGRVNLSNVYRIELLVSRAVGMFEFPEEIHVTIDSDPSGEPAHAFAEEIELTSSSFHYRVSEGVTADAAYLVDCSGETEFFVRRSSYGGERISSTVLKALTSPEERAEGLIALDRITATADTSRVISLSFESIVPKNVKLRVIGRVISPGGRF